MGAFEDFVNSNLGIRKPIITDSGLPSASSKAAGIIGTQYIDSDTYFLYEKTGENNSADWVKIGFVGQPRGVKTDPAGLDGYVQFNSGDSFGGSENLTYDRSLGLLSGESGRFDYVHSDYVTGKTGHFVEELVVGDPNQPSSEDVFVVDDGNITAAGSANFSGPIIGPKLVANTGYFDRLIVSGDALISGDFYVSGTTYVNEIVDTTVSGTISGYTGIFNTSSGKTGSFTESLLISGEPVLTGFEIPGGGTVVGGDEGNINFGGTEAGDVRNINFQQGGENVMVIDQGGDVNIKNDLYVSGDISGSTGHFNELNINGVNIEDALSSLSGDIETVSGEALASFSALSDDLNETGQSLLNSRRDYPVLTGVEFDQSTNILSFFRDFGATNIDVDLSSLAGGGGVSTYQSTLWWEENGEDLTLLNEKTNTSFPATQLFEELGGSAYSPRQETLNSNSEAAQYFEASGADVTIRGSSYLPPINTGTPIGDIPIATTTSLGVVQIGANLNITPEGVLSANNSSLTYQSTLWWEEYNQHLMFLNEKTNTSFPATQLFEESGPNTYAPREEVLNSNNEAAQYFEQIGENVTIRESSYLPPINNSAVSTQWFEDAGAEQLTVRETFLDTSNPGIQLWEPTGLNQYTPRSEPYSSNNESAQYFQETGDAQLTTTIN